MDQKLTGYPSTLSDIITLSGGSTMPILLSSEKTRNGNHMQITSTMIHGMPKPFLVTDPFRIPLGTGKF